jgi:hypothetical protein
LLHANDDISGSLSILQWSELKMNHILKNKKALSTVVTTLIILVVSVLLATIVTFYAINVTTNRTQQESLYMSNLHVWYTIATVGPPATPGWAEAAFVLVNTGGRDAVLQKITARSQASDWTSVYYWTTKTATISALSPTTTQPSGATITPTVNGTFAQPLNQASGVITLKSGYTLVVYINHPDSVGQNDVGTSIPVTAFTANAQWIQECNVEATTP